MPHDNPQEPEVILVDDQDREVGTIDKMSAHEQGLLHRAFSVLVFNSKNELLLQKRAATKYHSGGLWSNTCCSHPLPGENIHETVRRKLMYEMGIEAMPVFAYKFIYQAKVGRLVEYEYDYVFTARYDGDPVANPEEADDWRYAALAQIKEDAAAHPDQYTSWFKLILQHPRWRSDSGYPK
jgi:isopentenyl-diphosphate delta-isomerase